MSRRTPRCADHPDEFAAVTFHERTDTGGWRHEPACAECADASLTCLGCGARAVRLADETCDACGVHQDDVQLGRGRPRLRVVKEET